MFDMNEAIRDIVGTPLPPGSKSTLTAATGAAATAAAMKDSKREQYQEALMSELLTLLVKRNIISKDDATGIVRRARARSE